MRRLVRWVGSMVISGVLLGMGLAWAQQQVQTTDDPQRIIRQQLMEYAAAVANLQVALKECQAAQQPKAPEKK